MSKRLVLPPPFCPKHPLQRMYFLCYDEQQHWDEYACNVCGYILTQDRN